MLSLKTVATLNDPMVPIQPIETLVKETSLELKALQNPTTGNHPSEANLDEANRLLELAMTSSAIEQSLDSNTTMDSPKLTVIIPAFNEIATIEQVVNAVVDLPIYKQVILIDDGSTDGTREGLSPFCILKTEARVRRSNLVLPQHVVKSLSFRTQTWSITP